MYILARTVTCEKFSDSTGAEFVSSLDGGVDDIMFPTGETSAAS